MATTLANPAALNTGTVTDGNTPVDNSSVQARPQEALVRQNMGAPSAGISSVFSQPAVKKAMPAIIVLIAAALFLVAYSWIQSPPYRAVYPGLTEADRQAAYTALVSANFDAKIDNKSGELQVPGK